MNDPKHLRISPASSEVDVDEKHQVSATVNAAPRYYSSTSANRYWNAVKGTFLAKAPLEGAPLEYGGHRVPEEPANRGFLGVASKYLRFVGPGMIITVAFIDPDNFQSAVQDGQQFGYKLQDMVLISVLIACYLQYLCMKIGTVTGLDLAQMNHMYMPRWLELFIYVIAETCVIGAEISAVIGTAFAWNLLIPKLPLDAACVITVFDSLFFLLFYSPYGTLRSIRYFELFMTSLVLVIFIASCVGLSQVHPNAGPVFKGFLPSREIFVSQGLYATAGMIGGMLMPHALYVGSSLARPRLIDYDTSHNLTTYRQGESPKDIYYRPSLRAIKSTLRYAACDLCLDIFVVGIIVNAGWEMVSGAAVNQDQDLSDLHSLYTTLQTAVSPAAATAFAVALLFSGISAGIVTTMAGQTVMEGAFRIKINPFARRLVTRCIAIIPALIVSTTVGANGLANALTAVNYILEVGLVFVTIPVIWYTTHDKYMRVPNDDGTGTVSLNSGLAGTAFAWFIWLIVIVTAIASIVLAALNLGGN